MGKCRSEVSLIGKTALITGGNSGLGFETAVDFATRGCRVIIADISDSEEKTREIIARTNNPYVTWMQVDLSDFQSVRTFATRFIENESRLDLLINNAGTSCYTNEYTASGALKLMAINHYGHFLLTHLLIDLLRKTENSRVVFTSSIIAFINCLKSGNINDPPKVWAGMLFSYLQYGNTKLCNLITSNMLSEMGIFSNAIHPGCVKTNIHQVTFKFLKEMSVLHILSVFFGRICIFMFGKTAHEGAQNILYAALETKHSGQFISDCKPYRQPRSARDDDLCRDVWEESERLAGLEPNERILPINKLNIP
ncbi:PREDICTED: retinol dehydrogenase 11-like [Nicrophorus vespilloides]|uniref:Retinol dehydrogenase 11-like n=1 Tax=Nicrophorus vespilloides TaxID=110193 RepID=A0ABM1MUV5_NICVS|nr:PREDICTED: retinol dehydrogenase 11-like [Nicrophorus vespilloides]